MSVSHLLRWSTIALLLVAVGMAGCGDCTGTTTLTGTDSGDTTGDTEPEPDAPGNCQDNDGDGALGGSCPKATDCDDSNAAVHPGAEESCDDKLDNNCNGMVNENCPCEKGERRFCSSHVAKPTTLGPETHCKPGIQVCESDGEWAEECVGEVGPRESETCNGVDDDCDGEIDEGTLNAVKQCKDTNPNDPTEKCGPAGEGNGLDDDGDGMVDEDCSCAVPSYDPDLPRKDQPCYSGPIWTLGVGICKGGTMDCASDGTWGQCKGEVLPDEERCGDTVDNDCDGLIDEGCPQCQNPTEETCNGEDDDCDGIIDNGVTNACGGCGEVADEEKCGDGIDNNCNGKVEEACGCTANSIDCFPGPPSKAGVGACNQGTMRCQGESFGACSGYTLPTLEKCGEDGSGNGVDEDCDGEVDEGCGCTEGSTRPCGTATGICERGTQTCKDGKWQPCQGQTEPESQEVCNGKDDNCNGLVDERLKNACGKCGKTCYTHDTDPTNDGSTDDGAEKIGPNDKGNPTGKPGITLSEKSSFPPYLWAANHTHDTVSKFHTVQKKEVGRYWVADNPSRTAVDLDGNMWVIGRNDGRVTKIISDTSKCPDRNGNGQVDTSTASNLGPLNSAGNPLADECVVFSKVLNPNFPSGRGVTVDSSGRVWVAYSHRAPVAAIQPIDPKTFQVGQAYPASNLPVYKPDASGKMSATGQTDNTKRKFYGIIGDSKGYLYMNEWAGHPSIVRFNTQTMKYDRYYQDLNCGTYGIAIDGKNRVFAGCSSGGSGILMLDPSTETITRFRMPQKLAGRMPTNKETGTAVTNLTGGGAGTNYTTTALAVSPSSGDVWTAVFRIGYLARLDINDANLAQSQWTFIPTLNDKNGNRLPGVPGGLSMRGVGFDRSGNVWHLGPSTNDIWEVDPAKNERVGRHKVGVGGHYTYSDFTGSTALSFTAPKGVWTYYFDTKFPNAQPDQIVLDGHVPKDTAIKVRIRGVDSNDNGTTPWLPAPMGGNANYFVYPAGKSTHTIDLATVQGGGMIAAKRFEIEVRLTTQDAKKRPILHDVQLKWQRP